MAAQHGDVKPLSENWLECSITSNKKLLVTSASLLGTSALLVVTRFAIRISTTFLGSSLCDRSFHSLSLVLVQATTRCRTSRDLILIFQNI